ncbi:hypothetical protein Dimus_030142, partial [Dionaea muscipula]
REMAPVPPRDWEDHGNIHQIPKREDVCGIHHSSHLSPGKFKNVCTVRPNHGNRGSNCKRIKGCKVQLQTRLLPHGRCKALDLIQ